MRVAVVGGRPRAVRSTSLLRSVAGAHALQVFVIRLVVRLRWTRSTCVLPWRKWCTRGHSGTPRGGKVGEACRGHVGQSARLLRVAPAAAIVGVAVHSLLRATIRGIERRAWVHLRARLHLIQLVLQRRGRHRRVRSGLDESGRDTVLLRNRAGSCGCVCFATSSKEPRVPSGWIERAQRPPCPRPMTQDTHGRSCERGRSAAGRNERGPLARSALRTTRTGIPNGCHPFSLASLHGMQKKVFDCAIWSAMIRAATTRS